MPRGNDVTPRAARRVNQEAREAAGRFDETLLHNHVHECVLEDELLAQLLDAAERAYGVADERRQVLADPDADPQRGEVFHAASRIDRVVDDRVAEVVAQACFTVVTEAEDWTDAWSRDAVEGAVAAAGQWLVDHPTVVRRVVEADVDTLTEAGVKVLEG